MIDLCIRGSYYKLLLSPPQPTHVCNYPVTVHFFDLAVLNADCRTTWRALNTHAQAPSRPTGSEFGGHKPSVLCVLFYLLIPETPRESSQSGMRTSGLRYEEKGMKGWESLLEGIKETQDGRAFPEHTAFTL